MRRSSEGLRWWNRKVPNFIMFPCRLILSLVYCLTDVAIRSFGPFVYHEF